MYKYRSLSIETSAHLQRVTVHQAEFLHKPSLVKRLQRVEHDFETRHTIKLILAETYVQTMGIKNNLLSN
jgi:hypothetical protein